MIKDDMIQDLQKELNDFKRIRDNAEDMIEEIHFKIDELTEKESLAG